MARLKRGEKEEEEAPCSVNCSSREEVRGSRLEKYDVFLRFEKCKIPDYIFCLFASQKTVVSVFAFVGRVFSNFNIDLVIPKSICRFCPFFPFSPLHTHTYTYLTLRRRRSERDP